MEGGTPVLAIEGLRKDFGRTRAVGGIDLLLDRPGVYGFLGPNGAGKTTTFKCICALLRPTSGRVLVGGVDVQRDTKRAMAEIGVQFDTPAFYPYLSGEENLRVFATWIGTGCGGKIPDLLRRTGLDGAGGKRLAEYSWGMKQRLGLAAALLSDPKLILMDEPTSGLDPAGIADVRRLLPGLAYEQQRTVLLSSHRMDEVELVCDRVIVIHRGLIVADGTPAGLASAERIIEIRCDEPKRAATLLRSRGDIAEITQSGPRTLRLRVSGPPAREINRFLVERGLAVEQVLEERESLEEIFFRLTGSRSDDG